MPKPSPAYTALRELGMRPPAARQFLVGLRRKGFVVAEEKQIATTKQINRQVEIIIKLIKEGNRI